MDLKFQMAEKHISQTGRTQYGERDAHDETRTGLRYAVNASADAGYAHSGIESDKKNGNHQKKLKGLVGIEIVELIHGRDYSFLCITGTAGHLAESSIIKEQDVAFDKCGILFFK